MTATVGSIWRHPVKAHGREEIGSAELTAHGTIPFDREWAVAHEASEADGSEWVRCVNFTRAAGAPQLMAITASLDEATGRLTLSHPEREPLEFDPDTEGDRLIDWVSPLMPEGRAKPARLVRQRAGRGLTDSDFPSLTLCNTASHAAVERAAGRDLSPHRWRGNVWIDGLEPWAEWDWVGREVRIGGAVLAVRERTGRCLATHANPDTGERDVEMLPLLDDLTSRDFSVMAEVIQGGAIRTGDPVEVL